MLILQVHTNSPTQEGKIPFHFDFTVTWKKTVNTRLSTEVSNSGRVASGLSKDMLQLLFQWNMSPLHER